jgi:copper chaperone CopZ
MEILVFKTNLRFKKQVTAVTTCLNSIDGIVKWNVDLQDKDKVLRIEARDLSPQVIKHTLHRAGYFCEELED